MKPTTPRRVKGISPRVSHGLVPYQYQFCESIRRCWTRNQRNVSSHGVDAGVQYGQDGGHGQGPNDCSCFPYSSSTTPSMTFYTINAAQSVHLPLAIATNPAIAECTV